MDLHNLPTLRGITALAARPGGGLGVFAAVTAMSYQGASLVLHCGPCPSSPGLLPVTSDAERADLVSVAARLPGTGRAGAVVWCQRCAPTPMGAADDESELRSVGLLLATVAGRAEIDGEKLYALARAAGPRLTWRRRGWFTRAPSAEQMRQYAHTLGLLLQERRAHPVLAEPQGVDLTNAMALLRRRCADLPPLGENPVADQVRRGTSIVGEVLAQQHAQVVTLAESFPLHRLCDPHGLNGERLVLTYRGARTPRSWADDYEELAPDVLAPVVCAGEGLLVLRMPTQLVTGLSPMKLLGSAPVPDVDPAALTQVAQVAVAAAEPLKNATGRVGSDVFASLVAAAVTATADPAAA